RKMPNFSGSGDGQSRQCFLHSLYREVMKLVERHRAADTAGLFEFRIAELLTHAFYGVRKLGDERIGIHGTGERSVQGGGGARFAEPLEKNDQAAEAMRDEHQVRRRATPELQHLPKAR